MGKNGMPFSCRIPLINTIICYKKTQQQPNKRKVRKNQGATCSGTRGHFPRTEITLEKRSRRQYLSAPPLNSSNASAIPLEEMFIAGHVSSVRMKGRGVGSATLIMNRQRGTRSSSLNQTMKTLS